MRRPFRSLTRDPVAILVTAILLLAIMATLAGLFWTGGEGPATITTWRGQPVEIAGRGLYRDSSAFNAAGARGTDAVTLLLVVPMLAIGRRWHRRGVLRGTLLLAGGLVWTAYAYGSVALGTVAYTDLFLIHVALFGASLWTLIALLASVDAARLDVARLPRRGPGRFLLASGIVTAVIWLIEPIEAALTGDLPPSLGVSATLVTYAIDLAVIAPAVCISGMLVLRGRPVGYLTAIPLLTLEALLAPLIVAQTIFQLEAGVKLATGQAIGIITGFLLLAGGASWILVRLFLALNEDVGHAGRPALTGS